MAVPVKHGNCSKARRMHLFKSLPDCRIGIDEDYILFGARKKGYIHIDLRKSGTAQILVDADLERSCGKTVLGMERGRTVREECIADL